MSRIKVYTRSMNDQYYEMMRQLLPAHLEYERCQQFQEWWHAKDYLHYILQSDADFVINCDEDCFVYDFKQVEGIIELMQMGKYTHCGMPDRHICHHRQNLFVVTNPFFNVFNMAEVRRFYTGAWQTTEAENIECYNAIFLELAFFGKPLFLNALDHEDGISTDLGFALHTWYSRDPGHKVRILSRFSDAMHRRTVQEQIRPSGKVHSPHEDAPKAITDIDS